MERRVCEDLRRRAGAACCAERARVPAPLGSRYFNVSAALWPFVRIGERAFVLTIVI